MFHKNKIRTYLSVLTLIATTSCSVENQKVVIDTQDIGKSSSESEASFFNPLVNCNSPKPLVISPQWETKCLVDKNGHQIQTKTYDEIIRTNFRNSFLPIKLNGKWGFLNKQGEEVVPPKYDMVSVFIGDYATVGLNDKFGFIDKSGHEVVPPKYDNISGNYTENIIAIEVNKKWGFINLTGKVIIPPKYDGFCGHFYNNVQCIAQNKKVGFIDKKDNVIIEPKYDAVKRVIDGSAKIYLKDKIGYINREFDTIIEPKYDFIDIVIGDMTRVSINRKQGFINLNAQEVIPPIYDIIELRPFSKYYLVKYKDNWGYITEGNDIVIPIKYKSKEEADLALKN